MQEPETDQKNWKLGHFYFCRADRRVFVPRNFRADTGWTLNFAHPLSWLVMILIATVLVGSLALGFGWL